MSGHTPDRDPEIGRLIHRGSGFVEVDLGPGARGPTVFNAHGVGSPYSSPRHADELVRRWNAHADLLAALESAAASLDEIAGKANCGCYEECACTLHGCWAAESAVDLARAAIAKAGGA